MKTVSVGMAAHLAGEVTTLATFWKITRRDGVVMGFTDYDQDVVYLGATYGATTGFSPTSIESTANLAVDNLDVEGMLSSGAITEADITSGKYDFAEVSIFMLNVNELGQGPLKLRRGWLGEVTLRNQQFVAEVRGLTQRLSQQLGEIYAPSCRANLGDERCKVNLALHTVTGMLTHVTDRSNLRDSARTELSGVYGFGKLTMTSGANQGVSMEVKEYLQGGFIALALPLPYTPAVGDSYSLHKGCDKTLSTCINTFSNALNFRGEPHLPGMDRVLETAGTRTEW